MKILFDDLARLEYQDAHKFPYKILYSNEGELLYIIAIAHMHREPNYWLNRIKRDET